MDKGLGDDLDDDISHNEATTYLKTNKKTGIYLFS